MKNLINQAIRELKDNNVNDIVATGILLHKYKPLYELILLDFLVLCAICYEIPTRESYCNCKIKVGTSVNEMSRADLLVFINLYEKIEKEKDSLVAQIVQSVNYHNISEIKEKFTKARVTTPAVIQAMNDKAIQSTDLIPLIIEVEDLSTTDLSDFASILEEETYVPNSFDDLDTLSDEEKFIFNNSQGFPAPISLQKDNNEQNQIIEKLANAFKNQLDKHPSVTFNGLMAAIVDKYGHEQVDKGFNFYAVAWNNASESKLNAQEIKESYNRIFGNIEKSPELTNFVIQESNPIIETPAIEKSLEDVIEKTNIVTEFVFPIVFYLICISIPICIFFNAYFKEIFNFSDDFSININESDGGFICFIFFLMFVGGLYYMKEIGEKTKNPYLKVLYSENSIKIHFIMSMLLIAIVVYYLTISIAIIILIWSFFKLDGYESEWKFTKTIFYKWVKKIFNIKK